MKLKFQVLPSGASCAFVASRYGDPLRFPAISHRESGFQHNKAASFILQLSTSNILLLHIVSMHKISQSPFNLTRIRYFLLASQPPNGIHVLWPVFRIPLDSQGKGYRSFCLAEWFHVARMVSISRITSRPVFSSSPAHQRHVRTFTRARSHVHQGRRTPNDP